MYTVLAVIGFFFLLQVAVARLEKRMVWPYGDPEAEPPFADPSGYGGRWVGDAVQAGFNFLGWRRDLKGPKYQVCYGMLGSPERDCIVIVSFGTIFTMTIRSTAIYTPATDGRVYCTTDNQQAVEVDAYRRWRSQLISASAFPALLRQHRDFLRERGIAAQPFTPGLEAQEFRTLREERYRAMGRRGLIAFTDRSASHWRYTMWGALKVAALNYSIGLLRGMTGGRIPRSA